MKSNVRRRAAGPLGGSRPRSHRFARWLGRNWARIHYARRIEPTWLEINSLEIPIAGLPTALDGLRIVQLSDFHLTRRIDPEYIGHTMQVANRCEPALIALTGDFVHKGFRFVETIAQWLGELQAPLGVFAVLGNHDHAVRNPLGMRRHRRLHLAVERALARRGIRVLRNESELVVHGGAGLAVVGVDDLWSRLCDVNKALATVSGDVPRIVLAHNPRTIEIVGSHRCDLMLSGHTHGGQVNVSWRGAPILQRHRYRAGLYRHDGKFLYVNKGIGYGSIGLRYRTRPEVALFRLTAGN